MREYKVGSVKVVCNPAHHPAAHSGSLPWHELA